jgi:hypothetical protein
MLKDIHRRGFVDDCVTRRSARWMRTTCISIACAPSSISHLRRRRVRLFSPSLARNVNNNLMWSMTVLCVMNYLRGGEQSCRRWRRPRALRRCRYRRCCDCAARLLAPPSRPLYRCFDSCDGFTVAVDVFDLVRWRRSSTLRARCSTDNDNERNQQQSTCGHFACSNFEARRRRKDRVSIPSNLRNEYSIYDANQFYTTLNSISKLFHIGVAASDGTKRHVELRRLALLQERRLAGQLRLLCLQLLLPSLRLRTRWRRRRHRRQLHHRHRSIIH